MSTFSPRGLLAGVCTATSLLALTLAGAQSVQESAALMPPGTVAVLAVNHVDQAVDGLAAFAQAIGAPTEDLVAGEAIGALTGLSAINPAELELALQGELIVFVGPQGFLGAVSQVADTEVITHSLLATTAETVQVGGEEVYHFGQAGAGNMPAVVTGAVLLRDPLLITAPSHEALLAMITPHEPQPLAAAVAMPEPGKLALTVDLDTFIATMRPAITQMLTMFQGMAAQAQAAGGTAQSPAGMAMFMAMANSFIDVAAQVDVLTVTAGSAADAVTVTADAAFVPTGTVAPILPRHVENDLALGQRLPAGAFMALVSSFDPERGAQVMERFMASCIAPMAQQGVDPAGLQRISEMTVALYGALGDQIAYAIYPGQGLIPGVGMIMRSPDPASSLEQMRTMMSDPATLAMMTSMYGVPSSIEAQFEDLGMQTVGAVEAHHVRLSGLGAMMQAMIPPGTQDPQMQEVASQIDAIDYWFASDAENLYMTTESEPVLLEQMLAGAGAPFEVAPVAAAIAQGADLVGRVSLGGAMNWAFNAMPGPMPVPPQMRAAAESLAQSETGIWGTVTMREGGMSTSVVVPASDIAQIVQAAQAAEQQGQPQGPQM